MSFETGLPAEEQALQFLAEAEKRNPGPWVAHSFRVAEAARTIAGEVREMDPNRAHILGLLHDIGRREGVTGMRHVYDGYRFFLDKGFPVAARICLTHSFPVKDIRAGSSRWDCTEAEMAEIRLALAALTYDDYDRLLQLCDALALPDRFCLLEVRLVDVLRRYKNFNDFTLPKWDALFAILADFSERIGTSVYTLLPGIVESAFDPGAGA